MSLRNIESEHVLQAIKECDELGRVYFLEKYRFGQAKAYWLMYNGQRYDSKAIIGAAHGYACPDLGPLTSDRFSGGASTVRRKLENLGFTVETDNEATPPRRPRTIPLEATDEYPSTLNKVSRFNEQIRRSILTHVSTARADYLARFYRLLSRLEQNLGGARKLSDCSGRMDWPRRGVYFFRESGEYRGDTGDGLRVLRIGTHALKAGAHTTLWSRLSRHRGPASSGGGNHRGSIFRLLIGTALIERDGHRCPSWGKGSSAPREVRELERPLEKVVSTMIGDMPFLWLAIDDEPGRNSLRGYIERNAIALLSNFGKEPLDPPSRGWLGHLCNRELVRKFGLWNQEHVDQSYGPDFLDKLEDLIDRMKEAA